MMLKPLGENIVLKMIEAEETTKSGILLATNNKEKSQIGEVVAIGDKEEKIKVKDKVVVNKYAGTSIEYLDVEYYIFNSKDILAIVE
ncbi:MAG: co-chaperone GroES [Clostridia bacterium]|nr:co-chaperone GroES [Clostridia bacterium]